MHNALKWLLAVMLSLPLVAFAETAYITEKLEIPVRSGESRDYRIIRYLQAGAQVEILETYESGYKKIKDERGREGFVLGRYLVDRAPSFVIAGRLEAEVAKHKETIKRLHADLNNCGKSRYADASNAAAFLERFLVENSNGENPKWAHLDIAGLE